MLRKSLEKRPLSWYLTRRGKEYKYPVLAQKRKKQDDDYIDEWFRTHENTLENYKRIQKEFIEEFGIFVNHNRSVKGVPKVKPNIKYLAKNMGVNQKQIMRIWEDPQKAFDFYELVFKNKKSK